MNTTAMAATAATAESTTVADSKRAAETTTEAAEAATAKPAMQGTGTGELACAKTHE